MNLSDKNNIEFEIRDIGGSDVYYKRNIGDKLWLFSTKQEFELNKNIMDKKYSESDIERGAKIELEEHKKTLMKYVKEGVGLMDVARQIAIDHFKENPNSYPVEDIVSMNVPLFIRMLELAREDIKSDEDLHKFVEKVIIASKEKGLLTMQDYNSLVVDMPNEENFADGGNLENEFEIEEDEDRITISLKGIGEVILVQTFPEYEFIEDIDEDTLEELNVSEGDIIGKIEHIEVDDKYKGKGYAKLLMNKAIELAEEYGWMPLYLNASPMGSKRYGLGIEDLTGFYESFGFKVFLNQGGNNLMLLDKKQEFSNGGGVSDRIECHNPKCDWSWSVESGGDDLYVCHKCYTDNEKFYEKGGLIAPNGKPSNLTPEQYKLVRSEEFKKWFGDWENDPKNASKVVDENGEPMICYHGAYDFGFTIFSKKTRGISTGAKSAKKGFFFYDKEKDAKMFSKRSASGGIYEVFLKMKIPNIKNYENQNVDADKELLKLINSFEYDGAIALNLKDGYEIGNQYIVFEPEQIKLADGTNTTFDGNNPDIRFADGGEVEDLISQGIVELKMFATKPEHVKEYGLDSINPLYVKSLNVNENQRLKGVGKKVLQYIDDYAIKNGHDVVFGHITQKATMTKDNRTGYFTEFTDIDFIKHWLFRNGYNVIKENNDFYKVIASDSNDINNEYNPDIRFDGGDKIQLNSNKGKVNLKLSSYEDVTELVPVSELLKFREFNRNERPKYSLEDSKDNISKLEKALVENGVEEPLIIEYSLEDNSVLLIEGNHRLNVAENLGFDYLPARVVLRRREFTPLQKTKAFKVKGFTPDRYGYVPSDLKPSQVGIGGTTKAFEEGGVVEGQLHSECNEETGCGEKYDVGGVGHIIEVERDEAVIVSKAFQDNNKYEIKGTPSEIASALNVLGDGKNFDSGAEIKSEDGKKVEVAEIKKEAKNTDVETIDPNSIIINRRSMYDKKEYVAKGTPKEIASQINNLNDNGVKIVDGGSIEKA